MACFKGTLKSFISPAGSLIKFETLSGMLAHFMNPNGLLSAFEIPFGSLLTVCPFDVAGPHSLCLDDGTELWYADDEPFDFE